MIVDRTGFKVCGQSEWHRQKHGEKKARRWKNLPMGVNAQGCIVASTVTESQEQDPSHVPELLSQVDHRIDRFIGDGIFDQAPISTAVEKHSLGARVIIPPRKGAVLSTMAMTSPTQCDQHLLAIESEGRYGWKRTSIYYDKAYVENVFSRFKRAFGDRLRSNHFRPFASGGPRWSTPPEKAVRRPRGASIFGVALSSNDSIGSTSAHIRRYPLVKIRVRVGPSSIAGQGLFAAQAIRQGTKIMRYIGEKITHEESDRRLAAGNVYIFGLDERYAIDGSTPKNTARFINHSCDPNCHTEQFGNTIWIVALRDIQAGEELTYNYEYEIDDEPAEPCHCGAKNCCGYILGLHYWDRLKQPAPREGALPVAWSMTHESARLQQRN